MGPELSRIVRKYPPRYGPEWGSGGVFGLKYWRGIIYYTVSFEAEAHFISEEERVYRFEKVGPSPHSGGDTYNAVEAVDEKIYFGGWVHAPAVYEGKKGGESRINFRNKYSHLHEYDVEEGEVRLLWKEGIQDDRKWAGEISNIVYDPYEDSLLLSRLDGHANLGVYEYDRSAGKMKKISEDPSLKGTLLNEFACFDSSSSFLSLEGGRGIREVQFYDLIERKMEKHSVREATSKAMDGDPIFAPLPGCMASAYSRLFVFCRGCIIVGNPLIGEDFRAIRMFDFLGGYSPQRTMAIPYAGGILVAYNAYTHGILSKEVNSAWKYLNEILAPSVLLYISPPEVRIVGTYGARITSIEEFSSGILIGWNTMANVGEANASPFDTGFKGISFIRSPLSGAPSPFKALIPGERMKGSFGGIPVSGYKEAKIRYFGKGENEIEIREVLLSLPPQLICEERYKVKPGESIDVSSYSGILSFKLSKRDSSSKVIIDMRRCQMPHYVWIVPGELAVSPIPMPEEFEEYSKVFNSVVILPEDGELTRRRYDPREWEIYGVKYLHDPVPDFTSPRLVQMLRILEWIEQRRREGPVLVHCIGGVGRSGTVAACYLVYSKGVPPVEALRKVREKIPEAATSPDQEKAPFLLKDFLEVLGPEGKEYVFSTVRKAKYWRSASRVLEISLEISLPLMKSGEISKKDVRESFFLTGEKYLEEERGRKVEAGEGISEAISYFSPSLDLYHSGEVRRVDLQGKNPLKVLAYSPIEISEILEEAERRKRRLELELGRRVKVERYWPWRSILGFLKN